jgi:hypothetical protein
MVLSNIINQQFLKKKEKKKNNGPKRNVVNEVTFPAISQDLCLPGKGMRNRGTSLLIESRPYFLHNRQNLSTIIREHTSMEELYIIIYIHI